MKGILSAAVVLVLAVSAPADAQVTAGQVDRATAEANEAQQAMHDYAACLVQSRRRQVERYLLAKPFTRTASSVARQMLMSACLEEADIDFNSEAIRGPFYQALYRAEFRDMPAPDLGTAPVLDYSGAGVGANADINVNLRRFADCVVRQDQVSARALAFSTVGSSEESAAFRGLRPAMASCIAPDDTVSFQPALLRAVINEVLYRLSVAMVGRPMAMDQK